MPNDKDTIIEDLREEIERMKDHWQEKLNEAIADTTNLEKQLQDSQDVLTGVKTDLQTEKAKSGTIATENQELEKQIKELSDTINQKDTTADAYLEQVTKLTQLLQDTESQIEDIEAYHKSIQKQLEEEIKRTEERYGQVSEDLTRESSGTHAQDILIRTVLQESELGKVTMFIVDYFENRKRKVLAQKTMETELGLFPIITRKHLRYLHGLGVIVYHESSGEIKRVRQ
ncbi:MAG: hypothetical protein ACW98F_08380 [Candidatus Hodarchaeales archaeon]|jgi:chromosome segregation ATPase